MDKEREWSVSNKCFDKTWMFFFCYRLFISCVCVCHSVFSVYALFNVLLVPAYAYKHRQTHSFRLRAFFTPFLHRHRWSPRLRPNTIYINSVFDIAEWFWGEGVGGSSAYHTTHQTNIYFLRPFGDDRRYNSNTNNNLPFWSRKFILSIFLHFWLTFGYINTRETYENTMRHKAALMLNNNGIPSQRQGAGPFSSAFVNNNIRHYAHCLFGLIDGP